MVKRITKKDKEKAWRMYQEDVSISEIAEDIGVSYNSARILTIGREIGFKNYYEYHESLAQKRSQKQENKDLSYLIKSRLKELGKNQNWLAEQLGVTRQAVSYYVQGKMIPQNQVLTNLFSTLKVDKKPKSLDNLT